MENKYHVLKRPPENIFDAFMPKSDVKEFYNWCVTKEKLFIYGAGKIAKGIAWFLKQCDISLEGFVTSDTFDEWKTDYEKGICGIIVGIGQEKIPQIRYNLNTLEVNDVYELPPDVSYDMQLKSDPNYIRENLNLLFNIVDGCNLNCKGCKNFSPLAKKTDIYEFDQIKKDLNHFKSLGIEKINRVFVSGGEPTLHPNLFEVLSFIRQLYPQSIIELVTNGIELYKYDDSKWKKLKALDITLSMSDYNIGNIFPENIKKSESFGIKYNTMTQKENERTATNKKEFVKWQINLDKASPPYTYFNCKRYIGRTSIHIHNGIIAPCCFMIFSNLYFNKAFNQNLIMIENQDYVNLYETTAEEIFNFATTRYPYCGYCDMEKNKLVYWDKNKNEGHQIEDWI
ncbi:MAG: 4Fe-4S cluster-binding domain-containing protein [Oscillospiraceae bacterium]|jgi:MoaA/NifB/PqqE/SkfB family radical SAM enzyme|nr:4Fe-4S cluster-binding domain-containing protein [Oscillospiraceae bacterium]